MDPLLQSQILYRRNLSLCFVLRILLRITAYNFFFLGKSICECLIRTRLQTDYDIADYDMCIELYFRQFGTLEYISYKKTAFDEITRFLWDIMGFLGCNFSRK